MLTLASTYSPWLIIICFLAGTAYAYILYYSFRRNDEEAFSPRLKIMLALLRGLAVAFIAFLLLSPMIKSVVRRSEKPIIVIAADNSASVVTNKDSAFYRKEFPSKLKALEQELSKTYDVKSYTFSDKPSEGLAMDFSGKQTDMSKVFQELKDRYSNRNLAALIIAGDGLYNSGSDPLYVSEGVPYPVYSVALGDTSQQKDLKIVHINYNRTVLLGNQFPVEITYSAHQCRGSNSALMISSGDNVLAQNNLSFGTEAETRTLNFILKATKPGKQKFRVVLKALPGEISTFNNVREFVVDVLDARQKILIVAASPHPDLAALKQSLEDNSNYEVELKFLADFSGSIEKFNLVILHQVPAINDAATQLLSQLKNSGVPVLYILGAQSNIPAFNSLHIGLSIPVSNASPAAAFPSYDGSFSLFSLNQETIRRLQGFPPLNAPFGNYATTPSLNVLLRQKIGSVLTPYPLVMFSQGLDHKSGIIAGDGLWRWRLDDYQKNGNHDAFNELVSKTVQYLSLNSDKSRFRVLHKNYFTENEPVIIDAELYNSSYELVQEPDVNIVITDAEKNNYPFTFSRTSNAYSLDAGSFPPGDYSYKATVTFGTETFEKTGSFTILALDEETINTVANHNLMNNLAVLHGGEMVYPAQMNELAEKLRNREDIRTVTYSEKRYSDLVNIFLILTVIILLLSAEWFLRKRSGSY